MYLCTCLSVVHHRKSILVELIHPKGYKFEAKSREEGESFFILSPERDIVFYLASHLDSQTKISSFVF